MPEQGAPDRLDGRKLLTVGQFSELVQMHPKSIYRRIAERRQPGVCRLGRDIRIDLAIALSAETHLEE